MGKKLSVGAKKVANRYAVVQLVNSVKGVGAKKAILLKAVECRIIDEDDRIVAGVDDEEPAVVQATVEYIDHEFEQILREDALEAARNQLGNMDAAYQAVHDQVVLVKSTIDNARTVGGVNRLVSSTS